MRKLIAIILIIGFFACQGILASEKEPFNHSVKELYSAPSGDSNLVYQIPVEVNLLDISEDGDWYKVKISFNIGPFGYTYVGWTYLPLIDLWAQKESSEIASVSSDN